MSKANKPATQMYVLLTPDGEIDKACGALPSAGEMRRVAAQCRMGATLYESLGDDGSRWRHLKQDGYRVVAAFVTTFKPTPNPTEPR